MHVSHDTPPAQDDIRSAQLGRDEISVRMQRFPCILLAPEDICTLAFYGSEISEGSGRLPHLDPNIKSPKLILPSALPAGSKAQEMLPLTLYGSGPHAGDGKLRLSKGPSTLKMSGRIPNTTSKHEAERPRSAPLDQFPGTD
jgi:hypothetical protein